MQRKWLVVPLAVLASSLAALAWGQDFPRGRFGGRGGFLGEFPGVHPGAVLERLIFPCRAGCIDADRTCVDTAESTAGTCVTGSCGTQITAALTACQADRTSTDCETAASALRTCAASCLATEATAVSTCRTTFTSCLATCGNT